MEHQIICSREKRGLGFNMAAPLVRRAVCAALEEEGVQVPCEVNVLFTDDEGIHAINLEFRGVDRPTDVLSFPAFGFVPGDFDPEDGEVDPGGLLPLGDMMISIPQVYRQAEEYGNTPQREVSYLAVHSALHLLGYDHLDEGEEKRQMRRREKEIMLKLGLGIEND